MSLDLSAKDLLRISCWQLSYRVRSAFSPSFWNIQNFARTQPVFDEKRTRSTLYRDIQARDHA